MELDILRKTELPIVIFGAGFAGQVLQNYLKDENVQTSYFCDNKQNYSGRKIAGCPVIHSSELKQLHDDYLFIISAADIGDVVIQLEELGYENWLPAGNFLKYSDVGKHEYQTEYEFLEYAVTTCIQCHDAYTSPDTIFLRSVDIVITEKCSLKCKDCSNLMQYYISPEHYEADEIVQTIDNFIQHIDKVNEFRVIGGEPFMNKEIHKTVDRLVHEEKIDRVVIYTNGTIVPKGQNLESLKHPKLLMMITDYDELSRNHAKLIETLKENNISYHTAPAQNWTDCTSISPHHRSDEEQAELFKNCCAKSLFTLMDGKFYRCPFAAHIDKLGAVPFFENDHVSFKDSNAENTDREALREYIFHKPFIESCDFCVGRFLSDEKITPGLQTKEPLPYTKYR